MGCGAGCEYDRPFDDEEHSAPADEHAEENESQQEDATEEEQVDATEQVPDVDFTDLFTGSGCRISLTEERAISTDQLDLVMAHVTRRLTGGETWKARRFENGQMVTKDLTDPAAVQLYDVNTHVIVTATAALQLSLIEAMATSPQKPSYFVSHW